MLSLRFERVFLWFRTVMIRPMPQLGGMRREQLRIFAGLRHFPPSPALILPRRGFKYSAWFRLFDMPRWTGQGPHAVLD